MDRHDRQPDPLEASLSRTWPNGRTEGCLSSLDLAAFVDDRMSEAGRTRVETHLAACVPCLSAVRETRLIAAMPMPAVSDDVRRAARSLVRDAPSRSAPMSWRLVDWLAPARWVAAAAALLLACLLGYEAGFTSGAEDEETPADLVAAFTFGSLGADGDDDGSLTLLVDTQERPR